ncbi:MAG: 4-(cytidine 5'-diphospho)-2-C-methyl-D-erythritol kinase [Pseudomonadota bacterium]
MTQAEALTERAPAKLNLCLHVGPRRADGYHDIESLIVFTELGDRLTARLAPDLSLSIEGPFGAALAADDPQDNLVMRAAQALRSAAGVSKGAHLTLHKVLPVASGMGGGSADAAAALRLLQRLWGVRLPQPQIEALAFALGADVPACLRAQPVLAKGAGETLEPAPAPPAAPVVLVNPGVATSTRDVFKVFDTHNGGEKNRSAIMPDRFDGFVDFKRFIESSYNNLTDAAIETTPEIGQILQRLQAVAPESIVRMSGSGATVFAVCEQQGDAQALAAELMAAQPNWWVRATVLRGA